MSSALTTPTRIHVNYNMTEERRIMEVDMQNPSSFATVLGIETIHEKKLWIPRHMIGYDNNWRCVFKKVEWFLSLDKKLQEEENKRWSKFQKWERNIYNRRIGELIAQKEHIRAKYAAYSSNSTKVTPQQSSQRAQEEEEPSKKQSEEEDNNDYYEEYDSIIKSRRIFVNIFNEKNNNIKREDNNGNNETDDETDEQSDDGGNDGEAENEYKATSFFSPVVERQGLVDQGDSLKKKKKRIHCVGKNATNVAQQADCVAISSLNAAMQKVATAIDTCRFNDRVQSDPRVRILLLIMNEIKPSSVDGGGRNSNDLQAEAPSLIAITDSNDDIKPLMHAFKTATRRDNVEKYGNVIFTPMVFNENGYVSDVVTDYISLYKKGRKNPSLTARKFRTIIDEV